MKAPLKADLCAGVCGRRCSYWLRLQLALANYDSAAREYRQAALAHRDHIDKLLSDAGVGPKAGGLSGHDPAAANMTDA